MVDAAAVAVDPPDPVTAAVDPSDPVVVAVDAARSALGTSSHPLFFSLLPESGSEASFPIILLLCCLLLLFFYLLLLLFLPLYLMDVAVGCFGLFQQMIFDCCNRRFLMLQ